MAKQALQQNTLTPATTLLRPRLTEKAVDGMGRNVYVFDIALRANKIQVRTAIKSVYKVEPVKVTITTIPSKTKRNARTGRMGVHGGGKKATVYLKAGETISVM